MTTRTFCDGCGVEASLTAMSFPTEKLGVDVVLTHGGRSTGVHHVCHDCLAKAIFDVLPGFLSKSKTWLAHIQLVAEAKDRATAVKLSEQYKDRCVALEKTLKQLETTAALFRGENENLNGRIAALTAQMHQLQIEADKRVKRAEFELQEARSEDPEIKEYRKAAARNAAKRAGAPA
jgi:hypothetical protein